MPAWSRLRFCVNVCSLYCCAIQTQMDVLCEGGVGGGREKRGRLLKQLRVCMRVCEKRMGRGRKEEARKGATTRGAEGGKGLHGMREKGDENIKTAEPGSVQPGAFSRDDSSPVTIGGAGRAGGRGLTW
jgi:hypothetical protein